MRLSVTTVQLLRFGNPRVLHYLAVFFERDSFPLSDSSSVPADQHPSELPALSEGYPRGEIAGQLVESGKLQSCRPRVPTTLNSCHVHSAAVPAEPSTQLNSKNEQSEFSRTIRCERHILGRQMTKCPPDQPAPSPPHTASHRLPCGLPPLVPTPWFLLPRSLTPPNLRDAAQQVADFVPIQLRHNGHAMDVSQQVLRVAKEHAARGLAIAAAQ